MVADFLGLGLHKGGENCRRTQCSPADFDSHAHFHAEISNFVVILIVPLLYLAHALIFVAYESLINLQHSIFPVPKRAILFKLGDSSKGKSSTRYSSKCVLTTGTAPTNTSQYLTSEPCLSEGSTLIILSSAKRAPSVLSLENLERTTCLVENSLS